MGFEIISGGGGGGGGTVDVTAGETIAAGQACIVSLGSLGETAGEAYLADANFLTLSVDAYVAGICTSGVSAGETVTIQINGIVTGLSGLTAGSDYYLSETAGGITATAPDNAQYVGTAVSTTSLLLSLDNSGQNHRPLKDDFYIMGGDTTAGGTGVLNTVAKLTISTSTIDDSYSTLTLARYICAGNASPTRVICAGGRTGVGHGTGNDTIDYADVDTAATFADFGNLSVAKAQLAGGGNKTRSLFAGGRNTSATQLDVIDFIENSTLGNSSDFGDLHQVNAFVGGNIGNSIRCFFAGGDNGSTQRIDTNVIATTGNSTDFGDLLAARNATGGSGSATRAIVMGGTESGTTRVNKIEYFTVASTGTVSDFGDLTENSETTATGSNGVKSARAGGYDGSSNVSTIDEITIATSANATDTGTALGSARRAMGAASRGAGSLQ